MLGGSPAGGGGQWAEGAAGHRGFAASGPWEIMHRKALTRRVGPWPPATGTNESGGI